MPKFTLRLMAAISVLCGGAILFCVPGESRGQTEPATTEPATSPTTLPADGAAEQIHFETGELEEIGKNEILIRPDNRTEEVNEIMFRPDENTVITVDGAPAKVTDLRAGHPVEYSFQPLSPGGPSRLVVNQSSPPFFGIIVKIDGNKLDFKSSNWGQIPDQLAGIANEKTRVLLPGENAPKNGTLADLRPGMKVIVLVKKGNLIVIYVERKWMGSTEPDVETN